MVIPQYGADGALHHEGIHKDIYHQVESDLQDIPDEGKRNYCSNIENGHDRE